MTSEVEPTKVDTNSPAMIRFRHLLNSLGTNPRKEMESGFLSGTLFQLLVDDYLTQQFPDQLILPEWKVTEVLSNLKNHPITPKLRIQSVVKDAFSLGTRSNNMLYPIPDDLIFKESQPNHYRVSHIVESKLGKPDSIPRSTRAFFNLLMISDGKTLIENVLTMHLKRESYFIPSSGDYTRGGYSSKYLRVIPYQEGLREKRNAKVLPYTREQINQLVEKIVEGTLN